MSFLPYVKWAVSIVSAQRADSEEGLSWVFFLMWSRQFPFVVHKKQPLLATAARGGWLLSGVFDGNLGTTWGIVVGMQYGLFYDFV